MQYDLLLRDEGRGLGLSAAITCKVTVDMNELNALAVTLAFLEHVRVHGHWNFCLFVAARQWLCQQQQICGYTVLFYTTLH